MSLLISRYKLQNFLACQRRFQLHYVTKLAWPVMPVADNMATAFEKGEIFHRLTEQYFLGLPIELPADADDDIRTWWHTFQQHPPEIPAGKHYPEVALSVPIGDHFLYGRYDLLILGDDRAHIVDWKTERRPRSAEKLRSDWQTRLYLTMLAEGGHSLGTTYAPEQISITYWFARAPQASVTLTYDSEQHRHNWAELEATVARIERRLVAPDSIWPLTDDWDECARCNYRSYCNRLTSPTLPDESVIESQHEDTPSITILEPQHQ